MALRTAVQNRTGCLHSTQFSSTSKISTRLRVPSSIKQKQMFSRTWWCKTPILSYRISSNWSKSVRHWSPTGRLLHKTNCIKKRGWSRSLMPNRRSLTESSRKFRKGRLRSRKSSDNAGIVSYKCIDVSTGSNKLSLFQLWGHMTSKPHPKSSIIRRAFHKELTLTKTKYLKFLWHPVTSPW